MSTKSCFVAYFEIVLYVSSKYYPILYAVKQRHIFTPNPHIHHMQTKAVFSEDGDIMEEDWRNFPLKKQKQLIEIGYAKVIASR